MFRAKGAKTTMRRTGQIIVALALWPQLMMVGDLSGEALVVHRHGRNGIHAHLIPQSRIASSAASTEFGHCGNRPSPAVGGRAVIVAVVYASPADFSPSYDLAGGKDRIPYGGAAIGIAPIVGSSACVAAVSGHTPPLHEADALRELLERNHSLLI